MNRSPGSRPEPLSCGRMLRYFLDGAVPRERWQVGMELEKIGRDSAGGRPIPYDGDGPTVRAVLESIQAARGGESILEGGNLIGLDAPWGSITLEPGGQVEWSSPPRRTLAELREMLDGHLAAMNDIAGQLGLDWLDVGVDPVHALADIPWMPKRRYEIMREYFGTRGRLAHRMMTQTASIQCAFDFADGDDWRRKFKAAAFLSPVAVAMFANSSRVDGADSGYASFRQAIWSDTDPDRCGLPSIVFDEKFDMECWIRWVLNVPTLFRRRGTGLTPSDGSTFGELLDGPEGDALELKDWATHCSSIFTEVRSYTYIEVRSADLLPDALAFSVPTFWTGTLYDDDALQAALEVGKGLDYAGWRRAMDSAARQGLDGTLGGRSLRELAACALGSAVRGLQRGAPFTGDPARAVQPLEALASRLGLDVPV